MKLHLHPKLARYFVLALGNANLIVAGFSEIGIKDYAPGASVVFARWRLDLTGSNELSSDRPYACAARHGHLERIADPALYICLNGTPLNPELEKDFSSADFRWCCTAFRWEWQPTEVMAQLLREPLSKAYPLLKEHHPAARQRAEVYAKLTVNNAADAVFGIGIGDRVD